MKGAFKMIAALVVLAVIAGCGGSSPSADSTAPSGQESTGGNADKIVLRAGNNMADDHQWNLNLRYWAELVDEATDGLVEIQVYPNSQLGDDQELAEMIRSGNVDIQVTSGAVVGRWFEPMSITEMPYLFESLDHVTACIYGEPGVYMKEGAANEGFLILDYWVRANRQILSTTPINSLEDFKGMKIRVPETDIWVGSMNALGANPTPVAYSEAFTALQQGVVNAIENPLASMYTMRFHEVCNYLAITNHTGSFSVVLFSPDTWSRLPEDVREILTETMEIVTRHNNDITYDEDQSYIDKMAEDLGDKFVITYPDYEQWKSVGIQVHEELAKTAGAEELYRMIKELA